MKTNEYNALKRVNMAANIRKLHEANEIVIDGICFRKNPQGALSAALRKKVKGTFFCNVAEYKSEMRYTVRFYAVEISESIPANVKNSCGASGAWSVFDGRPAVNEMLSLNAFNFEMSDIS